QTVGVDDLAAIVGDVELRYRDFTALAIDFNVGNRADVSAAKLVFHIGESASLHHVAGLRGAFRARLPAGALAQALQELAAARILEVLQPELQRIRADGHTDLIDEALVAVGVLHPSRRANPRRTEWRRGEPVRGGADIREGIRNRQRLENIS